MAIGDLFNRLETVRRRGPGRWIARCPAHMDKSPSLAIRELECGKILLHCFAGCSVQEVLGSVGLDFDALYPERALEHRSRPLRRPFNAHDVLAAVSFETTIVRLCANALAVGEQLSEHDRLRLRVAADRISAAEAIANAY